MPDHLVCPECTYDLRGTTEPRCPECGMDLGFLAAGESLIPWERSARGFAAPRYSHTVWLAVSRPQRFSRAACLPVSYAKARQFQLVTVAIVAATTATPFAILSIRDSNFLPHLADQTSGWYLAWCAVCHLLTLLGITGVPSYLFHPARLSVTRQNRAIAMSYYACAPLALTPIAACVAVGLIVLAERVKRIDTLLYLCALFVLVLLLVWYWLTLVHFGQRLMGGSAWVKVALLTPILWAAVVAVCGVLLPAVGFWIGLVLASLS